MAVLALDCPHCHVQNVQFISVADHAHRNDGWYTSFFVCNSCSGGIAAQICSHDLKAPHSFKGNLQAGRFTITEIYPTADVNAAPDHTPDNIAAFYVQAVDALRRKHHDAAGAMCRKVVDTATRKLDPQVTGRLVARIDKLADSHKITPALREWAHAIRLDGNDASHDEDPFSSEEATDICNFCELFLMYVFTLPGMLKERSEKKGAA
ncbi:MAG: DUF4145 domain-containing protein [Betaproteobacteria bacterium]